jgi:hypothetical protein
MKLYSTFFLLGALRLCSLAAEPTRPHIDDEQPGFRSLVAADFTKVNSADDTWSWKDGVLHCTGKPVSVMRTVKEFTNFELVVEWMHEKPAGNSGVFLWATPTSIEKLTAAGKPGLPQGIEVQVLDHGYTDKVKASGGKTDWFGTNGDVFPVGVKMTPFPPVSPNGERSFPRKHLAKGHGEWNQYYIRAINGEVRLWVNGVIKQDFNTDDMAHKIPRCIEWASSIHTLEPGDVLATGTNHRGLSSLQNGDKV